MKNATPNNKSKINMLNKRIKHQNKDIQKLEGRIEKIENLLNEILSQNIKNNINNFSNDYHKINNWYEEPEEVECLITNYNTQDSYKKEGIVKLQEISNYSEIFQKGAYEKDIEKTKKKLLQIFEENIKFLPPKVRYKNEDRKSFNFRTNYMHILDYISETLSISKNKALELALITFHREIEDIKQTKN